MTPLEPPPKRPDRHYDFNKLNVAFAISALAFLAVTLWMVFFDYARPWKRFQAEFRDLERQKVLSELERERATLNEEQISTVQAEIQKGQEALQAKEAEVQEVEDEIITLDKRIYESDAAARTTKSRLDAAKYVYDLALQGGDEADIDDALSRVDALTEQWQEQQKVLEGYQDQKDVQSDRLAELTASVDAAELRLTDLRSSLDSLELRVSNLSKNIDYFMLNAPLMDFMSPTLNIEQVILPGLFHDINFTTIDRVDRCMTCHVAANRDGFEGEEWAHPYRSHPRLDLFVSDSSPHPYTEFGCTVCHAGLDRATDFARAGHSPTSSEQQEEWEESWGWERQKYLETPIYPLPLTEAGCVACHSSEVWTPGSQVQDVGRQLIFKMGCYGCHAIDYPAFRNLPRPGPDLTQVASKVEPGWAFQWIKAPREFRATTWMPHFFFQENIKGEVNEKLQEAEIVSLVAYIWDKSKRPEYPPAPAGDAARGEVLFGGVGCQGCHILDPEATRDQFYPEIHRLHGPNLAGLGSKTSAAWVYAWLKDPKSYRPDTAMPNLRLTDQEAADLTAYLMTSRNPDYENLSLPQSDAAAREALVMGYLRNTLTIEASERRLAEMDVDEENVFLGKETATKYGCFGCHDVEGFEDAKPIGVELTEEASKPLHLFDFGHVHDVPHTRQDWIRTKLLRPRIWDQGKELVKNYEELYRMPNFGMSEREADAVASNILGFTKESVVATRKAANGNGAQAFIAGRRLVTRYNCQGCHLIEGKGQAIRTAIANPGLLPPNLAAQGARVRADWLFDFLHDPSQVSLRRWLKVRMPTFGFSDEEANTIVAYFAALDGRDTFLSPHQPAPQRELVVGEEVFNLLQCAKCHEAPTADADLATLAPELNLAAGRLRHDWVPSWIKDPQTWIPGTQMPTNFQRLDTGQYASPLGLAMNTPVFASSKRRMMSYFSSEDELREYLNDVDRVTVAMRDYLWTLGN